MYSYLQRFAWSQWSKFVVIPPNSKKFSDWRRTCHVSLVKNSWRPRAIKTSWCPRVTTTWTFDSHVIRSCTFETAANLFASRVKQIIFYAAMAAKRFQTRTEEEIEELLHDKRSKSTNKATDNAVRTLRNFFKEQNLDESLQELRKTDLNSLLRKFCYKVVSWHLCIVLFWVGRYTRPSMFPSTSPRERLGVSGKQSSLFPLGPVIKCLLCAHWNVELNIMKTVIALIVGCKSTYNAKPRLIC